jgi:predicted O-methyltransferase YrrM
MHTLGTPSVEALAGAARIFSPDPVAIVRTLFPAVKSSKIDHLMEESLSVDDALNERYELVTLQYPRAWAIEQGTNRLLYLLVRLAQPRLVLEVGVADGNSSFVMIEALRRNGSGVLHSVDVNPNTGVLVDATTSPPWVMHIHDAGKSTSAMVRLVRSLGPIAFCFHDALHSYRGQLEDYNAIGPCLGPGAIFLSDDVHASHAFVDWCRQLQLDPALLFDARKVSGLILWPKTPPCGRDVRESKRYNRS